MAVKLKSKPERVYLLGCQRAGLSMEFEVTTMPNFMPSLNEGTCSFSSLSSFAPTTGLRAKGSFLTLQYLGCI